MSAIAGIWRHGGRGGADAPCVSMLDAQNVYGNDARNHWSDGNIAIGRSLARLVPEDRFDSQPIVGGGGRFVSVADVRIDNRLEIGTALGVNDSRLSVLSDAALLSSAWERWQENCLDRIIGDFAFAVWDVHHRMLFLARDFAGMRPLHFHVAKSLFAFASMPKGLHALPEIERAPDLDFVSQTVTQGFPPASGTWFTGIQRVRPGYLVSVSAAGVTEHRWWQPPSQLRRRKRPGDYAEALIHHLDEAVRARLRGETRVAAHLSGGLDSSAVATSAAQLLGATGKVTAYTALPRPGYCNSRTPPLLDEAPLTAAVAASWPNMDHVPIIGAGSLPLERLEFYTDLFDQPIPNLCNLPWTMAIGEAARARGMTVLLTGQYGNFGFSYDGLLSLGELLRCGRLTELTRQMIALRRSGHVPLRSSGTAAIRPLLSLFRQKLQLARPLAAPLPVSERGLRSHAFQVNDVGNLLKGQLAATGLDYRDPTADRRLVEFTFTVPSEEFVRGGIPRSLARRALIGRLPDALLKELRKGIQAPDWHEPASAQRDAMSAELDVFAATPEAYILPLGALRTLLKEWPTADWSRPQVSRAYRATLLRHISLAHFVRQASNGGRPRGAD